MSKKKNKKGKQRQGANRSKKRKQGTRKPHRSGASSLGLAKKTGDLYFIRSQAGLNMLLASGRPTLVDFWAPWCQPCLRMGPIFERIASKYGDRINFAKVDTQSLPKVGKRYGVQSIPTIIAFNGRQEARREVGLMNDSRMRRFAQSLLPDDDDEQQEEQAEQKEQLEQEEIESSPPEEEGEDTSGPVAVAAGEPSTGGGLGSRLMGLFRKKKK